MRKTRYPLIFFAAALLSFASSCGREDLFPGTLNSIPGFENVEAEDNCIILRLDLSSGVHTKAATERGKDALHENLINTIDCFFFKTGETDSPAIFRAIGRTVEDAVSDSTECYVKIYYNDEIARNLFGSTTGGSCEAFVIANASINYNSSSTLEQLRQSVIEYDFSQQEVQPYFVMCSRETAQVTLYTTTATVDGQETTISTAAGRVPLYRCASKVQLYLRLPSVFTDGSENCEYAPCPDSLGGIKLSLSSGAKKAYAYGNYTLAASDYISYGDRAIALTSDLIEGKEDYNYTHTPFYSYPMTWSDLSDNAANFVFSIPWHMVKNAGEDVDGAAERRYYKISANVAGRKFEANGFYRTFVYVQSRGEETLDNAEPLDECSYIISPWVHEGSVSSDAGSESISGEFVRYTFLVVEPDEVTLNNQASYTFNFKSSSDLDNYKVLIDSVCFYKYTSGAGERKKIAVGDNVSTVAQRTSGNASFIDKNEYSVSYNYAKGEIYFLHDLDEVYEQRDISLTVKNRDNISQQVKIHQMPSIMLQLHDAGDVFVNGYFGRVKDAAYSGRSNSLSATYYTRSGGGPGGGSYTSHTYTASLSPYYHCNIGITVSVTNNNSTYAPNPGSAFYYNTSGNTATSFAWNLTTDYGSLLVTTNNMDTSISSNFFTTEINLSAFNENNHTYSSNGEDVEYRIGDPRVKASASTSEGGYGSTWALNGYLYWNNGQTTQAWTNPGDIMICSMREQDRSLIAPRILISSALNANTGLTWEQVLKRGATYQEAGYPAGRWRLPSEAEMAYIVARQVDKTIPTLYAKNSVYWSGSGRTMSTNESGENTFADRTETETHSCRFVYDLWYWGDTPAATNEYHPNGHNTTY